MDWVLLWAMTATVAALWYGLSCRRERSRMEFWRERSREWCARYYEDGGA